MEHRDVKLFIATHKEYQMPSDPLYQPLHVGSALTEKDFGYERDDTKENISSKNRSFCELTGLYWAWKNTDFDFTGLVHYRRYFSLKKKSKDPFENILTYKQLQPLLCRYALFVPAKRRYYIETLYSHYAHTHYADQLDLAREIIREKYPMYISSFDRTVNRTWGYMFNMMIIRKDLLDQYCTWLFDILFELERRYDSSQLDAFQGRFYGRVSEIIFNVWLDEQLKSGNIRKDQIRELPLISTEPVDWIRKGTSFLKAKLFHRKYDSSF